MFTENALLFLGGTIFFPSLYIASIRLLRLYGSTRLDDADIYTISLRFVSAVQGLLASVVGVMIIHSVNDIMYDRYWLTNAYALFGTPYFFYDTWAMYRAFMKKAPSSQYKSTSQSVQAFVMSQPLMMCHHVILPMIYLPVIVWLRRGLGDFFVGCFFLFELVIPFISLRAVLLQLKMGQTKLYIINGLLLIVTFTGCRVLIFPYMYWIYSHQLNKNILQVLFHIPIKCNVGCFALLMVQLYWLSGIIKVAIKTVRKYSQTKLSSS